jgi:transcriptional regulator with XRE-family HTH domain
VAKRTDTKHTESETRLRAARRLRGLTQAAAAGKAGVSQAFWCEVERGGASPTIDMAHRMSAALGFQVQELWPPQNEGRRA